MKCWQKVNCWHTMSAHCRPMLTECWPNVAPTSAWHWSNVSERPMDKLTLGWCCRADVELTFQVRSAQHWPNLLMLAENKTACPTGTACFYCCHMPIQWIKNLPFCQLNTYRHTSGIILSSMQCHFLWAITDNLLPTINMYSPHIVNICTSVTVKIQYTL